MKSNLFGRLDVFVQRLSVQVKILGAVELLEVRTSVIAFRAHRVVHLLFKKPHFPELVLVVHVVQILLVFLLRRREEVALEESFNWMLKVLPFLWNVALGDLLERGRTDEHVNQGDPDPNGNGTE